jgi:hypothetical protein
MLPFQNLLEDDGHFHSMRGAAAGDVARVPK